MKRLILLLTLLAVPTSLLAHPILGFPRHRGVEPLTNPLYSESCGECHFAYQPGLLPARSWKKLMAPAALEDHFGENAELDEEDRLAILKFLTSNAADTTWHYKRSIKITRSLAEDEAPLRITEVPYIKKKHSHIPRWAVQDNRKVRSLSYCNRCHTRADKGAFVRAEVDIPGYRNWADLF